MKLYQIQTNCDVFYIMVLNEPTEQEIVKQFENLYGGNSWEECEGSFETWKIKEIPIETAKNKFIHSDEKDELICLYDDFLAATKPCVLACSEW